LGEIDRMGWWADQISEPQSDQIGSRLWVLERIGKVSTETAVEMESILKESLEWLIDDGIAFRVGVSAQRSDVNEIRASISIERPSGENIPFKFVWDGQALKLTE